MISTGSRTKKRMGIWRCSLPAATPTEDRPGGVGGYRRRVVTPPDDAGRPTPDEPDDSLGRSDPAAPARSSGTAADRLVAEARAQLGPRPTPGQLPTLVAGGALVVDIRPEDHRVHEGRIPGAVVVERNVLEWRLDPVGDHRIDELTGPDQVVVVVCDEGYASSLAAAVLRGIGLPCATDLDGGYRAWRAATSS